MTGLRLVFSMLEVWHEGLPDLAWGASRLSWQIVPDCVLPNIDEFLLLFADTLGILLQPPYDGFQCRLRLNKFAHC